MHSIPGTWEAAAGGDRGSTSLCASSSCPPTTRRVFAGLVSNTRFLEHDYLKLSRNRGALLPLPSSLPQHSHNNPRPDHYFSTLSGHRTTSNCLCFADKLPGTFGILSILPDLQALHAERLPLFVPVPLSKQSSQHLDAMFVRKRGNSFCSLCLHCHRTLTSAQMDARSASSSTRSRRVSRDCAMVWT